MGRDVVDFNADDATPTNTGQAIVALDVSAFGELAEFKAQVDALSRDIRGSERMKGFERIFLPGEQSHAKHRERSAAGIPLPEPLLNSLNGLGEKLRIGKLA